MVGATRGLLHVVGHDNDGVILFQFSDQLFNTPGRDRVQRRAGLIQQQNFRTNSDTARDAQTLLLATGERISALMQFIFGFIPQCGFGQCPLHALIHIRAGKLLKQAHAKGDVVINRHRERRRLLEHHPHFGAQQGDILGVGQNIIAIEQNFAFRTLLRVQLKHFVERTQQRGFTAA